MTAGTPARDHAAVSSPRSFHQLDGPLRFARRGDSYARARPSYPGEAIDAIAGVVVPHARVADIGSGTGIGARLIADRGFHVTAVEPNRDMISAASPHPRVQFVEALAERLPFSVASVALVTAFTSFHWFRPDEFYAEVRRITGTGARLAVIWNDWDYDDPFTAEYAKLVRSDLTDYPSEMLDREIATLNASPVFSRVEALEFANRHVLDALTLVDRTLSISYVLHEGERWERLAGELKNLHSRHERAGQVTHHYITRLFLATVAG